LTGSFLIDHTEVRYSLLYYGLSCFNAELSWVTKENTDAKIYGRANSVAIFPLNEYGTATAQVQHASKHLLALE